MDGGIHLPPFEMTLEHVFGFNGSVADGKCKVYVYLCMYRDLLVDMYLFIYLSIFVHAPGGVHVYHIHRLACRV